MKRKHGKEDRAVQSQKTNDRRVCVCVCVRGGGGGCMEQRNTEQCGSRMTEGKETEAGRGEGGGEDGGNTSGESKCT